MKGMINYNDVEGSFDQIKKALADMPYEGSYKSSSLRTAIIDTMNEHFFEKEPLHRNEHSFERCVSAISNPQTITQEQTATNVYSFT